MRGRGGLAYPIPSRVARSPVLATLAIAAGAAPLVLGWIAVAPNRLLGARTVPLPDDPATLALAAAFLLACGAITLGALRPRWTLLAEIAAAVALVLLVATVGLGTARATAGAGALARASPAPGAWIAALALLLAATLAAGRSGTSPARPLLVAAVGTAALSVTGVLSALSIAREANGRAAEIASALLSHLGLSVGALLLALLIAVPLSLGAQSLSGRGRPRLEAALLGAATAVQVVPSLALFGLLIVPLAALANAVPALRTLGIGGIGPAPAILGIAAYLVLPLARGALAGLRAAPAPVLDAARGQGLSERQVLWSVRIPLGAPVLRAALRLAAVQAIGLATLAALIGAGGLGTLVFLGIGQLAGDLILLGVLPILALSLLADALIGGGESAEG